MINRLEKLIGNKGIIEHHVISISHERFYIIFNYDYDDNESCWREKIINEFSPREVLTSFTNNIYCDLSIEKLIKLDRKEKLDKLYND